MDVVSSHNNKRLLGGSGAANSVRGDSAHVRHYFPGAPALSPIGSLMDLYFRRDPEEIEESTAAKNL